MQFPFQFIFGDGLASADGMFPDLFFCPPLRHPCIIGAEEPDIARIAPHAWEPSWPQVASGEP